MKLFDKQKIFRRSETTCASPRRERRLTIFKRKSLDHKKFSDVLSTEEYNKVDEPQYFGPYAHIRKQLDYNYHRHYRKERQWLQDSIIEDVLDNVGEEVECVTPTEPWLIFTAGPRGVGKKHVIRDLTAQGKLGLLTHVHIDPDEIRRRLPEFETYLRSQPDLVDDLTKKEAGLICEILLLASVQAGRNVILDGLLNNPTWHLAMIKRLKEEYPNLKFAIFHIRAPKKMIVKHAQKKALETGRHLSKERLIRGMEGIPAAIEVLRPFVDFACEILNAKQYEILPMDWDLFQVEFLQMSAWQPGTQGRKKHTVSRRQSMQAREATIGNVGRVRRRFSVLVSSEENNATHDMTFFGQFSHIRKTLDYTYHCNYTFERQHLQDRIIIDMLDDAFILDVDGKIGTVPTEPWIVFTAGAMGCGKSHTMQTLVEKKRFPLGSFVTVDPDEIRRLLPEYHMYINENPELAGELTRKEAGYIAEILTLAALQAGKNVLVDGSLRDSEWYSWYFGRLRDDFPSVRQAIIHVTAPREAVFSRAASRAISTGRIVPIEVLEAALEQVPRSVEILAPLVDYYAEINNPERAPDVELVKPTGSTWEEFRKTWLQTVAYVPNRRKILDRALKKMSLMGGSLRDLTGGSKRDLMKSEGSKRDLMKSDGSKRDLMQNGVSQEEAVYN